MGDITYQKYHVRNIDCANCAANIENNLKKLDGVEEATLDFANLTLYVSATDMQKVLEQVRKTEPDVQLIPHDAASGPKEEPDPWTGPGIVKKMAFFSVAFLLFLVILFFEFSAYRLPSVHLELLIVLSAYLLAGWNVLYGALRTIVRGIFFDENVLMMIATVGALAIGAYSEAVGVMIFYKVGEMLQELAVSRSRRSVRGLLAARPDRAVLKTAAGLVEVKPEAVMVGDIIQVKPGEKIPLDGIVVDGASQLDTSALTGESVPVAVRPNNSVMAGQINQTGALTIKVTRPFEASSIAKVMDLVENATARKARTEKFITVFARYYTPAVVLIAAAIAFIPPLATGAAYQTWIYRALVLLVISCPCALVVSIPLGYFGGIGRASRRGILVKGSNFIDALAAVKTVVFDKTGTLTEGVFEVKEVVSLNGFSKAQVLEYAAAAELHSNHPIGLSILKAYAQTGGRIDPAKVFDHTDYSGKGVTAGYQDRFVLVGNDAFLHRESIVHGRCEFDSTVAHVAVDGNYVGYILIGDRIRPDASKTVQRLRQQGVERIAMLTGDNVCAAEAVSRQLGLDDVYAELLPEKKVSVFEKLIHLNQEKHKTAFVGDGINDAPVIARADVGVAMGALGSDAAIETADVVLMKDSPLKMAEAVEIAGLTRRIVWQNIALVFVVKAIFITLGALGIATMWEAVFADMGTALVAVANSTRIIGRRVS